MKDYLCRLQALLFVLLALPAVAEEVQDPWESWNRKVFLFNETLDSYVMKPVAKGYQRITPDPVENSVSNLFANVNELPVSANALLQGKPPDAGKSLLRFLINSTVGIFGLFDVATALGVHEQKEDFGQTLAVWGVPSGNYLMLPFFGPSTPRGTAGLAVDMWANPLNVDHLETRVAVWTLKVVNGRASLLKAESLISGDRYGFLRDAYLQQRQYRIHDGNVTDTFDDESFDDDDWLND